MTRLGIGCAVVVEQLVVGADLGVDLIHAALDDVREGIVVLVGGLAGLEEDVGVLVGAAQHGMLRIQGAGAEAWR